MALERRVGDDLLHAHGIGQHGHRAWPWPQVDGPLREELRELTHGLLHETAEGTMRDIQ
jgi:hypothetical protein